MLEKTRHEQLSDKCAIHFFELKKINKSTMSTDRKELWMQLINAETEEELDMLMESNVAEIKETIYTIRKMSKNERIREEARIREKMLHDKASALKYARTEGRAEGKAEGLKEGEEIGLKKGKTEGKSEMIQQLFADGAIDEATFKKYAAM